MICTMLRCKLVIKVRWEDKCLSPGYLTQCHERYQESWVLISGSLVTVGACHLSTFHVGMSDKVTTTISSSGASRRATWLKEYIHKLWQCLRFLRPAPPLCGYKNMLMAGAHPEETSENYGLVHLEKCKTGSQIVSSQENDVTVVQDKKSPKNRRSMIKLHEISWVMVWEKEEKPWRKPTEKNWAVKWENRMRKRRGEKGLIKLGKCHRHQGEYWEKTLRFDNKSSYMWPWLV